MPASRIARIGFFLAPLGVALACAGCWSGRGFPSGASGEPSCEAVCDYYIHCRKPNERVRKRVWRACVEECTDIYVEDGVADNLSLRQFQRLQCHEAVAFVEGKSGRMPGEPLAARQKQRGRRARKNRDKQ